MTSPVAERVPGDAPRAAGSGTVDAARLLQFLDVLFGVQLVVAGASFVTTVVLDERWSVVPLVASTTVAAGLIAARRFVRGGRPVMAIATSIVALVLGMAAAAAGGPHLLPALAATCVIPPVLVLPHLPRRTTGLVLLASVTVAAVLTVVALGDERLPFVNEPPAWFARATVIVSAPAACALVLLLVRQNHLAIRDRTDRLRRSRRALVAGADEERHRAERDLHDGAQQRLQSALVQLALARRLAATDRAAAADVLAQTAFELQTARTDLRRLARGMVPPVLAAQGLDAALAALAAEAPLPVRYRSDGVGRLPDELERAVWFVCAEALQNAGKHAGPDASVDIELACNDERVRFSVRDDGKGFAGAAGGGMGMTSMLGRMAAIGGSLAIDSAIGRGTTLAGEVPLVAAATGSSIP
jgi:signal transduction histidine kinase